MALTDPRVIMITGPNITCCQLCSLSPDWIEAYAPVFQNMNHQLKPTNIAWLEPKCIECASEKCSEQCSQLSWAFRVGSHIPQHDKGCVSMETNITAFRQGILGSALLEIKQNNGNMDKSSAYDWRFDQLTPSNVCLCLLDKTRYTCC